MPQAQWAPLETIVLRLRNSPQVFTQLCSPALCPAPKDLRLAWQGAKQQEQAQCGEALPV